jgi:pimeloyl-ACP methyl ester carboxylesterase
MIFRIAPADGGVSVTLDVPAQSARNLPVRTITRESDQVTMSAPLLGAEYEAELEEGGTRMTGTWSQNGAEISLDLALEDPDSANASESEAQRRPQTPEPPFPYEVERVTFQNREDDIEFGATVTYPSGDGPFPAVVLISGSGQQDRNHEILGHQTFAVLADAFTRAGVAVLRYDDRGVGESTGGETLTSATTVSFARDARAAFSHLASLSFVDSERVGLVGLSEGGSIAPLVVRQIASSSAPVDSPAFLILLGASALPGDELMMAQSRAILEASEATAEQVAATAEANRAIYDIVLSDRSRDEAEAAIRERLQELGMARQQIDAQVASLLSPWYRAFLRYDPASELRALDQPVLALYGSLDTQVPPSQNAAVMRELLETAPVDRYEVRVIEGVNHLLQPATTGSPAEYGQIEITVAASVLTAVTEWAMDVVR